MYYSVLIILFIVSMLLLALAIVKPNLVLFWKHHAQRKKAMQFYGILTLVFFVLLIVYAPEIPDFTGDSDLDSIAAAHASQVEELEEIYPALPHRIDRFQQLINKSDTAVLHAFLTQRGYYTRKMQESVMIYNGDSLRNLNARLLMDLRNRMCTGYEHDLRFRKELAFDVTSIKLRSQTERENYAHNFLQEDLDNNHFSKFRILNDKENNDLNAYPTYNAFYTLTLTQINALQLVEFFKINNYIRLEKHGSVSHYQTFPALLPSSRETLLKWEDILETTDKKPMIDRYAAIQVVEERLSGDTVNVRP